MSLRRAQWIPLSSRCIPTVASIAPTRLVTLAFLSRRSQCTRAQVLDRNSRRLAGEFFTAARIWTHGCQASGRSHRPQKRELSRPLARRDGISSQRDRCNVPILHLRSWIRKWRVARAGLRLRLLELSIASGTAPNCCEIRTSERQRRCKIGRDTRSLRTTKSRRKIAKSRVWHERAEGEREGPKPWRRRPLLPGHPLADSLATVQRSLPVIACVVLRASRYVHRLEQRLDLPILQ